MNTTIAIPASRKNKSHQRPGRGKSSFPDVPVEAPFDGPMNQKLVKLVEKIRQHGQRVSDAEWGTIKQKRSLGEMLSKAKRIVRHGQWLAFLAYCGIPERWAQ